jgi:hypothetical protein
MHNNITTKVGQETEEASWVALTVEAVIVTAADTVVAMGGPVATMETDRHPLFVDNANFWCKSTTTTYVYISHITPSIPLFASPFSESGAKSKTAMRWLQLYPTMRS